MSAGLPKQTRFLSNREWKPFDKRISPRQPYRQFQANLSVFYLCKRRLGVNNEAMNREPRKDGSRWLILAAFCFLTSGILYGLGERGTLIEGLTNYPNPFNSRAETTSIAYQLPTDLPVKIKIYDLFGFQVREFNFMPGDMGARSGNNTISWDGTDESGQKVAKGGYVCLVQVQGGQPARGVRKIGVIH